MKNENQWEKELVNIIEDFDDNSIEERDEYTEQGDEEFLLSVENNEKSKK